MTQRKNPNDAVRGAMWQTLSWCAGFWRRASCGEIDIEIVRDSKSHFSKLILWRSGRPFVCIFQNFLREIASRKASNLQNNSVHGWRNKIVLPGLLHWWTKDIAAVSTGQNILLPYLQNNEISLPVGFVVSKNTWRLVVGQYLHLILGVKEGKSGKNDERFCCFQHFPWIYKSPSPLTHIFHGGRN